MRRTCSAAPSRNSTNNPTATTFSSGAADFGKPGEIMLRLNGRLSHSSTQALVERLQRVARAFSDQHLEDAQLPAAERPPVSLLLAARSWQIERDARTAAARARRATGQKNPSFALKACDILG